MWLIMFLIGCINIPFIIKKTDLSWLNAMALGICWGLALAKLMG